MFKILIFFWIFLLLISIFYVINNLMQKKENFNVSEVENDINSRNKIYLETNVIDIIPGKPGPTGEKGNDGDDGTLGREGKDGLIGNSGNDGDDAATVQFINPDNSPIGEVSVRNPNTDDIHKIKIPYGKKGDRGDTRKLNFCYVYKNEDDTYNTNNYDCYLEDPIGGPDNSKDMYLYIPKGNKGDDGDQGDCSMESRGFPGPTGDTGPDGDKGEKGPRGLEGKRGIDANKLNFGHNITGVEYKICFGDTPEDCIDVPKLKAINQDYQDKIDNKPYEDIISNTNNKYVPVLLRRINRLKNDLCLAHLTGDYSNGYLNDIKKDLDETYNVFNQNEGTVFKSLYNNVDDLNNYCSRFFNIVAVDFVFDKTNQDDCTEVDLYTFIETYLKTQGKWDDRFNTYKNTSVINIIIDDKSTDIISNSIDKAALIIDIDKIFEIFPNIYEIIIDVQRYITGKHEPDGQDNDNWPNKQGDKLNGGKGESGKKGGPAIDIIYKGTNGFKEIVIRINEKDGPETKITGGFGSLGGQGGKASKSFIKRSEQKVARPKPIPQDPKKECDSMIHYNGPDGVDGDGKLHSYEQAWVRGHGNWDENPGKRFDMVVFGQHHLTSVGGGGNTDTIETPSGNNGYFWTFKRGTRVKAEGGGGYSDDGWNDDFNCKTYNYTNNDNKSHVDSKYFQDNIPYAKYNLISPKTTQSCRVPTFGYDNKKVCYGNNFTGVCDGSWLRPRDGASWYNFTAQKCRMVDQPDKPQDCPAGESIIDADYCCPIAYASTTGCTEEIKYNEDGTKVKGEPGNPKKGADPTYNAGDKSTWTDYKAGERANLPGYVRNYPNIPAGFSDNALGDQGLRGDDGIDGKVISADANIYDKSKVIIFLNDEQYTDN